MPLASSVDLQKGVMLSCHSDKVHHEMVVLAGFVDKYEGLHEGEENEKLHLSHKQSQDLHRFIASNKGMGVRP